MTHEQLSKLIILSCKKAIKEEMAKLKQEILHELKQPPQKSTNPLVEQQKKFRQQYRVQQPRPKQNLSSNPTLNSILRETEPIQESYGYEVEDYGVNLPTREDGRPIISNNPKMNSVYAAMNRDYTELVQRFDEGKGNHEKNQLRSNVMNIMNNAPLDIQPFDEDMSWMDEVE